ncbi:MAG: ROK family protein [Chloroflexi bacterium]|nr:ROK family protein [Chloroflexota bacterium]MCY3938576.1 ROK family protein [Chloroflexota bacterium]
MNGDSALDVYAAVDFGGTRIRSAIVLPDGAVEGWNTTETPGGEGASAVVERVAESIETSITSSGVQATEIRALGVAAPGPLDHKTGTVLHAPNIPGFENVQVAGPLIERLGFPVFLGNDANLAALAEHAYGAGRSVNDMVYVTVSTGVGGGVLIGGELLLGATGNAGEVGHITVNMHGDYHQCGNLGCVEMYASGGGIGQQASAALAAGRQSSLRSVFDERVRVTGREVIEAARIGDGLAVEIVDQAVEALAAGILGFVHVLNPELVIIGGGVANAGDILFEPLRKTVYERALPGFGESLRIEPWTLGERVGILGAAEWARRNLRGRARSA